MRKHKPIYIPLSAITQRYVDRIARKMKVDPSRKCWLWKKIKSHDYGKIRIKAVGVVSVHRVTFTYCRGEIPSGMDVLHRCDVRLCVNPDHLFLGTDLENARDREQKGRGASHRGVLNGKSRLTDEQILAIRQELSDGTPPRFIAAKYTISKAHVHRIKKYKNWSHVTPELINCCGREELAHVPNQKGAA